jgi:hypothetical protein
LSELLGCDEVSAGLRWGTGSRWVAARKFFVCTPPPGRELLTTATPRRLHWVAVCLVFFLPGRHEKSLRTTAVYDTLTLTYTHFCRLQTMYRIYHILVVVFLSLIKNHKPLPMLLSFLGISWHNLVALPCVRILKNRNKIDAQVLEISFSWYFCFFERNRSKLYANCR